MITKKIVMINNISNCYLVPKLTKTLNPTCATASLTFFSTNPASFNSNTETKQTKAFNDIPRETGIRQSFLGLLLDGGAQQLHRHADRLHQKLGPIYRDKLGPLDLVFLADADSIRQVSNNEGKHPSHSIPEAWRLFNKVSGIERGLFFKTGPAWKELRRPMNKVFLSDLEYIKSFDEQINEVTRDLFKIIDKYERNSTKQIHVTNLKLLLCKWSVEATSVVLFGRRIGCLGSEDNNAQSSKAEQLVDAITRMFKETSKFQILPANIAYKLNLQSWKRFKDASTEMLDLAQDICQQNINNLENNNFSKRKCLSSMLLSYLNPEQVSKSLIDFIVAATDTTSNSLQWILHNLGLHHSFQTNLARDISINDVNFLSADQVNGTPHLKGYVKEILRLYPTAPFLSRTLNTSINLNGYHVPPNQPIIFSLYTTSRMNIYFKESLEIKPERWVRSVADTLSTDRHPYASLPFGVGARSCIGKRLAELQIHLLIAAFIKHYEIAIPENRKNIDTKLDMILTSTKPIELLLTSRKK